MIGTLLIADDDQGFTAIVRSYFEAKGHQVLVSGDGLNAAMNVFDHKPQVVIMDIKMPGPYGISVYESLQHDPETARIPVIFVSGVVEEEAFRRRIPEGPRTRFLIKPVDLKVLDTVVHELLEAKATK